MDKKIDFSISTPADYSVIVKNIPRNLNVDYKNELYALQNAFKDKFKDLFHGHFPNKNINAIVYSILNSTFIL